MEAAEKQGSGEQSGSPARRADVLRGGTGSTAQGENRPLDATRDGQQDTHSGTHESRGSSFTGNALESKKDV